MHYLCRCPNNYAQNPIFVQLFDRLVKDCDINDRGTSGLGVSRLAFLTFQAILPLYVRHELEMLLLVASCVSLLTILTTLMPMVTLLYTMASHLDFHN